MKRMISVQKTGREGGKGEANKPIGWKGSKWPIQVMSFVVTLVGTVPGMGHGSQGTVSPPPCCTPCPPLMYPEPRCPHSSTAYRAPPLCTMCLGASRILYPPSLNSPYSCSPCLPTVLHTPATLHWAHPHCCSHIHPCCSTCSPTANPCAYLLHCIPHLLLFPATPCCTTPLASQPWALLWQAMLHYSPLPLEAGAGRSSCGVGGQGLEFLPAAAANMGNGSWVGTQGLQLNPLGMTCSPQAVSWTAMT